VTFDFTDAQVAAFVHGVVLASEHPEYPETVKLLPSTVAELRADLLPSALRVAPPARGAQK